MSVENAFQAIKVLYTDLSKEDKAIKFTHILSLQSAKQARAEGRALPINEEKLEQWNSISGDVLQALMKASFEQNKDAAQALVDTGDRIIKHQNAKGVEMDKRFAPALTQIRQELIDEGYAPRTAKQQINLSQKASQNPSTDSSKKYYYYNSKPLGGVSVSELKTLMKHIKSFVVTSDMPGEGTDSTTQYIPYSEYKDSYFAYFADRISCEIELTYGISQDEFSKKIIYYDKSKKAMVVKSKGLYNMLEAFGTKSMYDNSNELAQALGRDFDTELLADLLWPSTNQEIGEEINTALYGDRRIIDSSQLELFEDQSMLVKMAEKVGMSVEQLKQNLESRQEYINKSLKDYPANEALDELADQIDEQCK